MPSLRFDTPELHARFFEGLKAAREGGSVHVAEFDARMVADRDGGDGAS